MSHEQPTQGLFSRRRGDCGDGRFNPDFGNRYHARGGPNTRGRRGCGGPAIPSGFPHGANIKEGLDTSRIETILAPAQPTAPDTVPIENVKYVASYNWVDTENSTIVVPGPGIHLLTLPRDVSIFGYSRRFTRSLD